MLLRGCASPEALALRQAYVQLAEQSRGLDGAAVARARDSFTHAGTRPRIYADPPWSMPKGSVRVIAMPLEDAELVSEGARLVALARHAARQIALALPADATTWTQPLGTMHATIFHPGLSPTAVRFISDQAAPSPAFLREELRSAHVMLEKLNLSSNMMALVGDRLVMTASGVLLLLLRPADECEPGPNVVDKLRAAATAAFPYAASKQASFFGLMGSAPMGKEHC